MAKITRILFLVAVVLASIACANRGIGPTGGPKDSIPPVMVREEPLNGTVNFRGKQVQIYFNEYLQLSNVAENVLISPPMPHQPEVKANGKHIQVSFQDTLVPNTTYTIDFGNAICDYHEKNPIYGYSFAFSTGPHIDTLEAYGQVFYAANLNPVIGAVVGIQENLEDSAFSTRQFTRIAKSDSSGYFAIHNIREGDYRYYALMDADKSYTYQPGEALAFTDEIIHPFLYEELRYDTIWEERYDTIWPVGSAVDTAYTPAPDTIFNIVDTLHHIDTIRYIARVDTFLDTYAEPGDLVLLLFEENKQRHYMLRATRDERHRIAIPFSVPLDSMPTLEAEWIDSVLVEFSAKHDSVILWLRDSSLIMSDTLELAITYLKSDSLYNLVPQTDSLVLNYREPRLTEKALEAKRRKEIERRLVAKTNASNTFQVYDTLRITFDYPVDSIDTALIALYEKKDTLFIRRQADIVPRSGALRQYDVLAALEPEHLYELRIDSAAATDIYGRCCLASKAAVTVKSMSDYATLRVHVPMDSVPVIVQLLDDKDVVVRQLPVDESGSVYFEHLELKSCYLRLFLDWDGDGRWTTGDWAKKRQPEPVYYFPKHLSLKANWDFDETFDYTATPQLESKPSALIKPFSFGKKK